MPNDHRKKGCQNTECEIFNKQKFDASYQFCPICGQELVFVCAKAKCYNQIEDTGIKHRICRSCEAKTKENENKVLDIGKKAGAGVAAVVVGVAGTIGKNIVKEGKSAAVKKGEKVVKAVAKEAVKMVIKK